jgi:hypothetical protein
MNRVPLFVCILTLFNLTLFGQSAEAPKVLRTAEDSAIHVPPQVSPALVADTPLSGMGSDLVGQWNWVAKASVEWAQDYGGTGWGQIPSDALPAGAVLGTVP